MALQKKIEVKVISREMIQPSSPTPSHLRRFKLSFHDQYSHSMYNPMILHYPQTNHNGRCHIPNNVVARLKHSLAEALSIYYPLAGRIKDDNMYVDCSDEGALFIESRVNIDMSTFLIKRPDLDNLFDFVPAHPLGQSTDTLAQVLVQVNVFTCGGISIGWCGCHKIIDGATTISFMKCWAAIVSGQRGELRHPDLTTASVLFPPKMFQTKVSGTDPSWILNQGTSALRRFVFDSRAIRKLKTMAASPVVPNPSGSEVVGCFIWKCIMNSSEKEKGSKQPWMLVSPKNIRSLTTPPMTQYTIGNIFLYAVVNYDPPTSPPQLQKLVSSVRKGFQKVDARSVQMLQGDQDLSVVQKMMDKLNEIQRRKKREAIMFSSIRAFKYTELDFGWGKPIWTSHIRPSSQSSVYVNQIILAENARSTDGMEAWLVFGKKTMDSLENDPEFLAYASPNPSILEPLGRL